MAAKKITKRWLLNSFGVILFILTLLCGVFAFTVRTFYYNSVTQSLVSTANAINTLLISYSEDDSTDYSNQVRGLVENFEEKDKMELMAVDSEGMVIITSSGFDIAEKLDMPDFDLALQSPTQIGIHQGLFNGERTISVSLVPNINTDTVSAMRLVVSMAQVDKQITLLIMSVVFISVAILFFVGLSGSYFISSIVNPIGEVGKTARKIAGGDFKTRLEKTNNDEIGELCDIFNHMAEELSRSEQIKNDFISSVSHELRTPLTAIRGWAETLVHDDVEKTDIQKGMHVIMSETERLSSMVEELLDFSRMQSGKLKLIKGKCDIIGELSDAVLMYTQKAKRDGKELIYDEPEIYQTYFGDQNRLRQVFINVIDNALKYSDSGDTITVSASYVSDTFVIKVEDTGCGISAEDLPKIKNKFYKANLTRRGSGIGLAVADEIISRHGGTLDVDSMENVGSTITITLPQQKKSDDLTAIESEG